MMKQGVILRRREPSALLMTSSSVIRGDFWWSFQEIQPSYISHGKKWPISNSRKPCSAIHECLTEIWRLNLFVFLMRRSRPFLRAESHILLITVVFDKSLKRCILFILLRLWEQGICMCWRKWAEEKSPRKTTFSWPIWEQVSWS